MIIGTQCISFAIVARRYAASRGLLPADYRFKNALSPITLERSLMAAGVLLIGGLAGVAHCLDVWSGTGFGPLRYGEVLRLLVVSGTAITLATQISFTSFLSAFLDIEVATPLEPETALENQA
jgi:hypothetical protein